jgi:hypothetical protein
VSLPRLQNAIDRLARKLARAKGLFEAVEQPGRQLVLQFAGGRATLAPAGMSSPGLSCSLLKSAFSRPRRLTGSWMDASSQGRFELNLARAPNAARDIYARSDGRKLPVRGGRERTASGPTSAKSEHSPNIGSVN